MNWDRTAAIRDRDPTNWDLNTTNRATPLQISDAVSIYGGAVSICDRKKKRISGASAVAKAI